jgi:Methylamine utilisation protein MauE
MRTKIILRVLIGFVLLATSAGKLLDVRGFAGVLRTYEAFPENALLPVAIGVPLAELALALWLFSGWHVAGAAAAALAMQLAYAGWAAVSVLRGLKLENCGCFGVFLARPLGWRTVLEDLVMVGLSASLLAFARRRP